MARVGQVTIIGLGLIGGSLGMALRRRRLAGRVTGVSRRAATIREAKRRGAIDWGTTDLREAVASADLVVVAAPVDAIALVGLRAARWMRSGSVLTDVGSTKAQVVAALEHALPRGIGFVGAHPVAGSERRGISAADARLFDGAACILTPTPRTSPQALRAVRRLWSPLARVITMSPQAHDRLLGAISHLPHLVSYSLAAAVGNTAVSCTAPSLLEMTRIAQSDPDLWDDILLSNRAAILQAMRRFDAAWAAARRSILRDDASALKRFLTHAKATRDSWRAP